MPHDQSHAPLREEIRRSEGVLTKQLMDARNRQLLAALDENERLRDRVGVLERENSDLYSEIASLKNLQIASDVRQVVDEAARKTKGDG